jgi:hypothetical protein
MDREIEIEIESNNEWDNTVYLKGFFQLSEEYEPFHNDSKYLRTVPRFNFSHFEARYFPRWSLSTEPYPFDRCEEREFREELLKAFGEYLSNQERGIA